MPGMHFFYISPCWNSFLSGQSSSATSSMNLPSRFPLWKWFLLSWTTYSTLLKSFLCLRFYFPCAFNEFYLIHVHLILQLDYKLVEGRNCSFSPLHFCLTGICIIKCLSWIELKVVKRENLLRANSPYVQNNQFWSERDRAWGRRFFHISLLGTWK